VRMVNAYNSTPRDTGLSVYFKSPASACHIGSHCNAYAYPHAPFLIMNKDWSLYYLSCCWMGFELLLNGGHEVFPFHILVTPLQIILVDSHFITSDSVAQKGSHSS
jgi:hypothetical protein